MVITVFSKKKEKIKKEKERKTKVHVSVLEYILFSNSLNIVLLLSPQPASFSGGASQVPQPTCLSGGDPVLVGPPAVSSDYETTTSLSVWHAILWDGVVTCHIVAWSCMGVHCGMTWQGISWYGVIQHIQHGLVALWWASYQFQSYILIWLGMLEHGNTKMASSYDMVWIGVVVWSCCDV